MCGQHQRRLEVGDGLVEDAEQVAAGGVIQLSGALATAHRAGDVVQGDDGTEPGPIAATHAVAPSQHVGSSGHAITWPSTSDTTRSATAATASLWVTTTTARPRRAWPASKSRTC